MKKLFIIFGLGVASIFMTVQAQDTITFTWKGGGNKSFKFTGDTYDDYYIVDWGDGYVANGGGQSNHVYIDTNNYTVSVVGCRGVNHTAWYLLDCSNKQVSSLNLNGCHVLQYLYCNTNQLPLSELYAASEKISITNNKRLGPQFLPMQQVAVDNIVDFSSQAIFDGINTVFVIEKDYIGGAKATLNIDYIINNGIIVFKKGGNYFVNMTNSAIKSEQNYPAIVYAEFDVRDLNTDATLSNLTVSKEKLTPTFHKDTVNYTVDVPYSATEINITAIASDTNATISGTGIKSLNVGTNPFIITVTAEDKQTTQNYTIMVNRADTIIDSTGIEELTINNERLIIKSVEIFDIMGRKYVTRHCGLDPQSPTNNTWQEIAEQVRNDVSELPAGIYIMRMQTNQRIINKKIIKY